MSNKLEIFNGQDEDGSSIEFKVSPREGVGIGDTEHSAYFEIFGSLGGGTLQLQKKCQDGTYRDAERETAEIAANFPSGTTKVLIIAMNFKDASSWKFVLADSTSPSLNITGVNMQKVSS